MHTDRTLNGWHNSIFLQWGGGALNLYWLTTEDQAFYHNKYQCYLVAHTLVITIKPTGM